jgi:hypothetical protein
MEPPMRNGVILSVLIAACALYWFGGQNDPRSPDHAALTVFMGTWTDENGPPGNYVRFSLVPHPSGTALIQLNEGKGQINGLLGEKEAPITWGYESFTPLRLNFIVGNRALVVPVRLLDRQHLELRFVPTADYAVWSSNTVWDSPEVVRLTRTGAEEP